MYITCNIMLMLTKLFYDVTRLRTWLRASMTTKHLASIAATKFFMMWWLKTWLRVSMNTEHLTLLAIVNIHWNHPILHDTVVDNIFVIRPRKIHSNNLVFDSDDSVNNWLSYISSGWRIISYHSYSLRVLYQSVFDFLQNIIFF